MPAASKYTLKPTLCKKFSGIIWRIETDEENSQLAVETRIPNSKEVFFSVLNYRSGESLLDEIQPENHSWWNLDRVHQNTLFLHGYLGESTPEHKGVCAIDTVKETVKWQNFQVALEDIIPEGLVVYNPSLQPRSFMLLSPETGNTVRSRIEHYTPLARNITYPEYFPDPALLPSFLPDQIVSPVMHLKVNDKECWSFHTGNNGLYNQWLMISKEGDVVLADILAADIQKMNPESFFMQKDHLFCIRSGNREIVSYLL